MQRTLVEIFLIVLSSVILREDICQVGIYLRVDVLLALDLLLDFSQYFQAVMMLTKIQPLLGLGNSEIEHGILVIFEAVFGFIEEDDGLLEVGVLRAHYDCNLSVLERI